MQAGFSSPAKRVLAAALAVAALSALSAWGLTRLTIDDDLRIDSRVVNPKWVRLEEIFWSFGSYDTDIIVVLEADDFFTAPRAEALKRLVAAIEAQPLSAAPSSPTPTGTLSTSGTPSPSAAPSSGGPPALSGTPPPSGKPTLSGAPSLSGKPTLSGKPAVSGVPAPSGVPSPSGALTPANRPTLSGKPTLSGRPTLSGLPSPSGTASPTGKAILSGAPKPSGIPTLSGKPALSGTPSSTRTPSATAHSATTNPPASSRTSSASDAPPPADTAAAATPPPIADTQSIVDGKQILKGIPLALLRDDMSPEKLQQSREAAIASPLIIGQTLSHDGRTTLVLVRLTEASYQRLAQVEYLRDFVERTARQIMEPVGVRVRITGTPAVRVEVFHAANRDLIRFGGIAAGVAMLVGMLLLRSIVMPLVAAATAGLALLWTIGFAGLAEIPANVMTIDLALALAMTTIAGALFAQLAARRARETGGDLAAATARSVWATGIASFAVAAGSLAWLRSDGIGVANLGLLSAVGALGSFAAVALVVLCLAPSISRPPASPYASRTAKSFVERITSLATARAGLVSVAAVAATIAAAYASTKARPNLHLEDNLPTRGAYVDTMRHCGRVMGGVYHVAVVVRLPEGTGFDSPASEAVHRDLEALLLRTEPLTNPMSLVNVVEGLRGYRDGWSRAVATVANPSSQSGKMFVNLDKRESLATARIADVGTAQVEEVGRRLDAGLDELRRKYPGVEFELTGMPIVAARALDRSLRELILFTAIGAAVSIGALAIGLRSFRGTVPVVAAASLALAATLAGMTLPGMAINYGNVVVPHLVVMLSFVCSVQIVSAAQEPAGSVPSPSLAIWGSMVILGMFLIGSAVFLASEISTRRAFGVACCIGLAIALIAHWVVVPALVTLLVRRHYDPSRGTGRADGGDFYRPVAE